MKKLNINKLTAKTEKYLEIFNKTGSKYSFWKFHYFFKKLKKKDPTTHISAVKK